MAGSVVRRAGWTRREAIQRGLVLAGLAGAAGSGPLLGGASPAGAEDAPLSLSFGGANVDASSPALARGVLPGPGDELLLSGDLLDRHGNVTGQLLGTYLQLVGFGGTGPTTPASLQEHTFVFAQGTLHGRGLGAADLGAQGAFVVIGGTGAFAKVQGSYTAVLQFLGLGGDGSAHFDFTRPEADHGG